MIRLGIIYSIIILLLSCSNQDKGKIVFDFSEKGEYIYPCDSLVEGQHDRYMPSDFKFRKGDSVYFEPTGFNFDTIKYIINPKNEKDTLLRMQEMLLSYSQAKFLDEPNLSNCFLGKEIYRFHWGGAFAPIRVISLSKEEKKVSATVYRFQRQTNEEGIPISQVIDRVHVVDLSLEDWNDFEKLIKEANFWNLYPKDTGEPADDGSSWLLEGHKENQYRFVHRRSPEKGTPIRTCGEFLSELVGLEEKEIY